MTNQITATNRLREAPWVGIGVKGQWTDYREALADSQLGFTVEARDAKVEIFDPYGTGFGQSIVTYETVPGVQVNLQQGTNRILGCVSSQYGIIQNEDAFQLLEPFTDAGGVITNAGMTEQGLCFMVLRMRQANILGDDWDFDVMCTNSFNGKFPCALIMVPTRIICQNMYRSLMGKHDGLLHIRHGSLAPNRLKAAQSATAKVLTFQASFESTLGAANSKLLPVSTIESTLLPMLFPYPKAGTPREVTSRERADQLRQEFMDVYYAAPDNVKYHGKSLGFINAYYDYLSHRNPTKCMPGNWADRRLSGLVSGNDVKRSVIKEAL